MGHADPDGAPGLALRRSRPGRPRGASPGVGGGRRPAARAGALEAKVRPAAERGGGSPEQDEGEHALLEEGLAEEDGADRVGQLAEGDHHTFAIPRVGGAAKQSLAAIQAGEYGAEVYIARRPIPADASCLQWVMGVKLSWWGRRRGKQGEVVQRLADMAWPVAPLVFVSLDGRFAPWLKKLRALADARLV